jgi:hypothetical protein
MPDRNEHDSERNKLPSGDASRRDTQHEQTKSQGNREGAHPQDGDPDPHAYGVSKAARTGPAGGNPNGPNADPTAQQNEELNPRK